MKEKFVVTGMTCAACSAHVEKAAGALPGVDSAVVNLMLGTMLVDYDPEKVTAEQIISAVESGGYGVVLPEVENMEVQQPRIAREGAHFGVRFSAALCKCVSETSD